MAGRVQVSATTAALLRDAGVHTLEYRGKVAAKGCAPPRRKCAARRRSDAAPSPFARMLCPWLRRKGELDTYWLVNRHSGTPYRAPLPDRRSSALSGFGAIGGIGGLGRRASARSSAFSVGRSSAASSVSDRVSEHLSSIAVEGPGSREGSQRSGAGGSYRNPLLEEGGSVRRALAAPAGTTQLEEGEEPLS